MISINQIKHINSLKQNKFRKIHKEFIAEGEKTVAGILSSNFEISGIFALEEWLEKNKKICKEFNVEQISEKELKRISSQKTPNNVLAVVKIPENEIDIKTIFSDLILMLDNINDPGNLGTIIRIADWFGIKNIICSENTVDLYNPKVVQATTGSIARVKVYYTELKEFLQKTPENITVYGTLLEGGNISKSKLKKTGIIIIGSESHGISKELFPFIKEKIKIPEYLAKTNTQKAESLNASIATAIVCYEFRRNFY